MTQRCRARRCRRWLAGLQAGNDRHGLWPRRRINGGCRRNLLDGTTNVGAGGHDESAYRSRDTTTVPERAAMTLSAVARTAAGNTGASAVNECGRSPTPLRRPVTTRLCTIRERVAATLQRIEKRRYQRGVEVGVRFRPTRAAGSRGFASSKRDRQLPRRTLATSDERWHATDQRHLVSLRPRRAGSRPVSTGRHQYGQYQLRRFLLHERRTLRHQ